MKVKQKLKESWDDTVLVNLYQLHDSTDALEDKLEALTERYANLERDFFALSNSYRELKLKIK